MFCPNCGKADQTTDAYCRNCGAFLTDFSSDASLISRILGANTPDRNRLQPTRRSAGNGERLFAARRHRRQSYLAERHRKHDENLYKIPRK